MSREVHVRFCERPEVKLLRPTHPQIITVRDGKVWLFGTIEHWCERRLNTPQMCRLNFPQVS